MSMERRSCIHDLTDVVSCGELIDSHERMKAFFEIASELVLVIAECVVEDGFCPLVHSSRLVSRAMLQLV